MTMRQAVTLVRRANRTLDGGALADYWGHHTRKALATGATVRVIGQTIRRSGTGTARNYCVTLYGDLRLDACALVEASERAEAHFSASGQQRHYIFNRAHRFTGWQIGGAK